MIKEFLEQQLPERLANKNVERIGIGGFILYASIKETASKTATITTNPVENGSVLNDHIIKNPTTITIEGEVADIYLQPKIIPSTLQQVFPPIGIIQQYLPGRTNTQISKLNSLITTANDYVSAADEAIDTGTQLYNYFKGKDSDETISQKFLSYFDTVYESRSIIDVECIDKVFNNMGITSFVTTKIDKNNYTFAINLQKIIEAKTTLISLTKNATGDAKSQGSSLSDKGTQKTKEVDQSFASALLEALS